MDKELIERLAKEAAMKYAYTQPGDGRSWVGGFWNLYQFAALVAEECAKIATNTYEGGGDSQDGDSGYDFNGDNSAEAIRAKFPPPT